MVDVRTDAKPSSIGSLTLYAGLALLAASFTRLWHIGPFHPSDGLLFVLAVIWCVEYVLGKSSAPQPLLAPLGWAVVGLGGLALAGAPVLGPGFIEVAKVFAVLIVGTLIFANIAYFKAEAVRATIAAATLLLVAVAVVQYLMKADAVNVAGLLDNRTLYGACVAAGAPFVLSELAARTGDKKAVRAMLSGGTFVLLAAVTILSAPMLILFALASLVTAALSGQLRGVVAALALAMVLIGGHELPRDNAAALVDSVSTFDANGHTRRIAIEAYAGAHAIADRPWLGHGPGNYQHVVSSAQYRGTLPPPAENRVEKGTNPGYMVATVEFGIPAALLFAATLLGAGLRVITAGRAANAEAKVEIAPVISAFVLAGASCFTVLLINGPGFLLAAVLGLCVAQRKILSEHNRAAPGSAAISSRLPRLSRRFSAAWIPAGLQFAGVASAIVLGVLIHHAHPPEVNESYDDMVAADLSGKGRAVVVLEAEDSSLVIPPMRKSERRDASAGQCLGIDEGAGKPPRVEGSAVYAVDVAQHGQYRVWIRAWWSDGCANSVAAGFDGGPPYLMGNDGTYAQWHWVRGPVVELKPGRHMLTLFEREDNLELDEIALSNDDAFTPTGALAATNAKPAPPTPSTSPVVASAPGVAKVDVPKIAAPTPRPVQPIQPAPTRVIDSAEPFNKAASERVEPAPVSVVPPAAVTTAPQESTRPAVELPKPKDGPRVMVGVGGAYRDGFEGHLVSLGIPYVRLRDDQLGDINELKDIDVLMVSEAHCGSANFMRTLYAFLASGRTAVVEFLPEDYAAAQDPEDLFFRSAGQTPFQRSTLIADDSPYFKNVARTTSYPTDVTCNWIPPSTRVSGVTLYGGQSRNGGGAKTASALMVRSVGKGKLYFLGVAAGFSAMWRGRKIDPFLVNVMRDAVGSACLYPFADLQYAPHAKTTVTFSDDFMRNPGQAGGWKILEGEFALTGASSVQTRAFAVQAKGTSFAAIGNDSWKEYRVASAVFMQHGEAGVWQATASGSRLTLRLRENGRSVILTERSGADEKILAEKPAGDYVGDWRRLSLFRRDGVTQGFVDGEPVIRSATAPACSGPCGVCTVNGDAYFDDFAALDTATLTPGRDVAPGEEASERCLVRYHQRCSEKLSIYSPVWMLRAYPTDQNFAQVALPLFTGGELCIDDSAPQPIAASEGLPLVRVAPFPKFDLALHTGGWRDYHFGGRVTDWYTSSGEWKQINRWSCNPEYEWYGGLAQRDTAVIWHKHAADGPVAMEVLMAPRADRTYHEEQGRDLNLVVYGNGKDLTQGYLFTVLSEGRGCQLSKNGAVVASAPKAGLEASGHTLHHSWFSVAAIVSGTKIQFYFDRRLALEYDDKEPLSSGKLGIWTRQNKISVGRATLSFSK